MDSASHQLRIILHLLIIDGSDASISAALRAHELDASAEVTLAVADGYPNFSICGPQAIAPLAFSVLIDHLGSRALIVSSALSISALIALSFVRNAGQNVDNHVVNFLTQKNLCRDPAERFFGNRHITQTSNSGFPEP
jgi:hypothetical protein